MTTQQQKPESDLDTEPFFNDFNEPMDEDESLLKRAWKKPLGKIVIVGGGGVALLYAVYLFSTHQTRLSIPIFIFSNTKNERQKLHTRTQMVGKKRCHALPIHLAALPGELG